MNRVLAVTLIVMAGMWGSVFAANLNTPEDAGIQRAIGAKINKNWWIPWGANIEDLQATVRIRLTPTGELLNVSIAESSGNPKLDESLIKAVKAAMPLPIPSDRMADYADFNMTLKR